MIVALAVVFLAMVLISILQRPRRTLTSRLLGGVSLFLALVGLVAGIGYSFGEQGTRWGLTLLLISLAASLVAIVLDATFCTEVFRLLATQFWRRRSTGAPAVREIDRSARHLVAGLGILVRVCMLVLIALICALLILVNRTET